MEETRTGLPAEDAPQARAPLPDYAVVLEAGTVTAVPLPTQGTVEIGNSRTAAIRVADPSVARVRARLALTRGAAEVIVLPGAGTAAVNGEALDGSRALLPGDVIEIGAATIVVHRAPRCAQPPSVLAPAALRRRFEQELARSARYGSTLALLVVDLGAERGASAAEICAAVTGAVRFVDIVGFDGAGEVQILLPETADSSEIPARRVLESLSRLAPGARAGLARCPADGVDADALMVGARLACAGAAPRAVAPFWKDAAIRTVGGTEIAIADPRMQDLFRLVGDLAQGDLPALVLGETGTGKELVARALHEWSPRRGAKLVAINCAAVAETLLESELFGHERGAFTGADRAKIGLLEAASGGTVFLDEIGESSPHAQAGLLRVLETKLLRRLGSVSERPIDVRIVAASNRPLGEEAASGRFRSDLFYRLGAATVVVPPLRERPLDVPLLARHFLARACERLHRPPLELSEEATRQLLLYRWPGNVRELKNLIEYLASMVRAPVIEAAHLPETVRTVLPWQRQAPGVPVGSASAARGRFATLADEVADLERTRIVEALAAEEGVRVRVAARLGLPLRTLLTKMKAFGLGGTPSSRRRSRDRDDR